MDLRSHIYSPTQNIAVWMAAWHLHVCSTDDFTQAMQALEGPTDAQFAGRLRAALDQAADFGGWLDSAAPHIHLRMSGPGDPLPAVAAAALQAADVPARYRQAVIVVGGAYDPNPTIIARGRQDWLLLDAGSALPEPVFPSPGQADQELANATRGAAGSIAAATATGAAAQLTAKDPRLLVGSLSDFYDTPGLPAHTPPRAARLFARADRVAAIIETVTDRLGNHSLDPQLLALSKHVRTARMAGVAYAVTEWRKQSL